MIRPARQGQGHSEGYQELKLRKPSEDEGNEPRESTNLLLVVRARGKKKWW